MALSILRNGLRAERESFENDSVKVAIPDTRAPVHIKFENENRQILDSSRSADGWANIRSSG